MSDLTLYDFKDLEEKEIKNRLLEEYKLIRYGDKNPEYITGKVKTNRRNVKLYFHNIRVFFTEQIRSNLFKKRTSTN